MANPTWGMCSMHSIFLQAATSGGDHRSYWAPSASADSGSTDDICLKAIGSQCAMSKPAEMTRSVLQPRLFAKHCRAHGRGEITHPKALMLLAWLVTQDPALCRPVCTVFSKTDGLMIWPSSSLEESCLAVLGTLKALHLGCKSVLWCMRIGLCRAELKLNLCPRNHSALPELWYFARTLAALCNVNVQYAHSGGCDAGAPASGAMQLGLQ